MKTYDYKHIAYDTTVTIELTAEEMCAIFAAYDRSIAALTQDDIEQLAKVIGKLKDEVHN